MKLTSSSTETSFLNEQNEEYEEERNGEEDIFTGSEIEAINELNIGNTTLGDKRKVLVVPHSKAKQVRSNKQVK